MKSWSGPWMAAVLVLLIVLFRSFVSGWGPPDAADTATPVFGIAAYPADNLSYVSWAEQARGGRWLFEILYTTTEHGRLFFNPLFLAVGKTAALFDTSSLLVLNVLAVFALPVVVIAFTRMCRLLGLSAAATFSTTCLAIGGAGISWVRKAIEWSGLDGVLPVGPIGPDLSFYDVYPILAYFVAPYHALSLAILSLLVLAIISIDDPGRPLTRVRLAVLWTVAIAVATVRPHTAIMVALAYAAATAASIAWRMPAEVVRRRLAVGVCLCAAMVPPVLYFLWVSQHPVWVDYARAHPPEAHDWAVGFFLLWALAAAGLFTLGRRTLPSRFAFPAAWAIGAGVLLLGLNGFIYPKVTYGATLAMALLAGVAIDRYIERSQSRTAAAAIAASLACVALVSPAIMLLEYTREKGTRVYADLFDAIETIRRDAATPFTTVLTDCGTGVMLPGLGGTRVFCGHWALTDHNRRKIVVLSRLGFLAGDQPMPSFPDVGEHDVAAGTARLRDQIGTSTFEYLVVRKRHRIYDQVAAHMPAACTLQNGEHYAVFKMCPAVRARLYEIVSAHVDAHLLDSRATDHSRDAS